MRAVAASAFLVVATGSVFADGDSLDDMLGPREIAVGEALRGGATGASAIGLNPAGLPLNRELVFEGGYGYRQSDGASLVHTSACDSTSGIPGCFFYDYAGSNPTLEGMSLHRTTHVLGAALAYPLSPRFSLGSTMKYFRFDSDVMNEAKSSGFTWDLGATARVTDILNVGVAGYNLIGASSVDFPRAVGGGIMAHPIPALSASFDARWRLEGNDNSARYGGGLEYFLSAQNGQTGFPIRAGVLHDNGLGATYVSGGLGLATLRYSIDVTGRFAASGPSDKLVIASMRFFGPRLQTPSPDAPQ